MKKFGMEAIVTAVLETIIVAAVITAAAAFAVGISHKKAARPHIFDSRLSLSAVQTSEEVPVTHIAETI